MILSGRASIAGFNSCCPCCGRPEWPERPGPLASETGSRDRQHRASGSFRRDTNRSLKGLFKMVSRGEEARPGSARTGQTSTRDDTDLDFGHVEPTPKHGSLVKFQPLTQAPRLDVGRIQPNAGIRRLPQRTAVEAFDTVSRLPNQVDSSVPTPSSLSTALLRLCYNRDQQRDSNSYDLLRYFIPVSHMTVTMVASGPSCSANRKAAMTLPPVEVPAKRPSSRASRMTMATASSVETCSI